MRILIGCEYSGIVRNAFIKQGHDAISCDILPTEAPGPHIQGDVLKVLNDAWDMAIFFPPCTHLALSGARWFKEKIADGRQAEGIKFFLALANAPIPRIAIENPIGIMSRIYRKPDQIIQPYYFGDSAQKATCLWLKNLPPLFSTEFVDRGMVYVDPRGHKHGGVHTMRAKKAYSQVMLLPPSPERWKIRSRTFQGVADAMAHQWSNFDY